MEQADLAIATSSDVGDFWCLPRIHMIRARLFEKNFRNADEVEASLRTAIDVATAQCAKGSELRAATSLARLWRDQGRRAEAHDLLALVYGWFTEGFDTKDLKEAKALLEEL